MYLRGRIARQRLGVRQASAALAFTPRCESARGLGALQDLSVFRRFIEGFDLQDWTRIETMNRPVAASRKSAANSNDQEWRRFCDVLGHPRWTQDPRFASELGRVQHRDALNRLVESWTSQYPAGEVMARLQAAGIAAGVVQNAADLEADPQLTYRGQSVYLDHPEVGVQRYDAPAFHLPASPAQLRPVPMLGQHNDSVFKGLLGLSDAEYEALERDGVFE